MNFRRRAILTAACAAFLGHGLSEAQEIADSYDLVVAGGTPAGVACAVRAAREGLDVMLVTHTDYLGGILANGLGVWDTLYEGKRAPIYDEVRQAIFDHYRETYGVNSPQYQQALPGKTGHTNGKFEPKVAEAIFEKLALDESPKLTILRGFYPVGTERDGRLVSAVFFQKMGAETTRKVPAKIFADCTYEGDLMAAAGISYRVGRESRDEFDEPHAGKIFMQKDQSPEADERRDGTHRKLNIRHFGETQAILPEASTGTGDRRVQAFNFRTILTDDPENRIPITKPENHDPEFLKTLEYGSIVQPIPNRKIGWNRPQLVGPHNDFVEGDWATRRRVADQHRQATIGLLWFLQHDSSVPKEKRNFWIRYGLPKDEFAGNGNFPRELYVREARRLNGRATLTEHDFLLSPDYDRTPIHTDSIAFTDWYMDAHACGTEKAGDSLHEGKMMLHKETFPAQVPYRSLLPKDVDNFLVPVCLSSTHVAWGAVRLEPTWMHIAESAAFACVQAVEQGKPPADIDVPKLIRTLADHRVMIAFFNNTSIENPDFPAIQIQASKGILKSYDADSADEDNP